VAETQQAESQGTYPRGEVVVEVGDDKCRCMQWPMTKQTLRGAWVKANLFSVTMHPSLQACPDLPGMRVGLDARAGRGRVFDPLNLPEFKETLEKAQAALESGPWRKKYGPEKDVEYPSLRPSEVKSWLYWMRRLVDGKSAKVLSGRLPTMEEIEALPGKTRIENWNSSSRATKFREDAQAQLEHAGE
jgi:hypothetical protein